MEAKYTYLNSLVNKTKAEFANWPDINWLNPYKAQEFQVQRDNLLFQPAKITLFKETKPYYNHISKGCRLCGEGQWSCLFITNKCNANCFYCPAPQLNDETPSTQGFKFNNPEAYALYLKHFGFKAVAFSGGEPLLFFDRTLAYLKAIRKICKKNIYTWMYTNGILATKDKLKVLANNGLDEIRFDIGATGYKLDKVRMASGLIKNITIEIPAIPEEQVKLISLLPQMVDAGVHNLNLHQLRMTRHNVNKLNSKSYTLIPTERPLVLESELTALEIIHTAQQQGMNIGINYCSFCYKNRFQKAGYRKKIAAKIVNPKSITENGYIRQFKGDSISYRTISLSNSANNSQKLSKIELEGREYFYTIVTVYHQNIPLKDQSNIQKLIETEPTNIPHNPLLFEVWQYEYIEKGLREY